jgi:ABC-type multidrug transport system permease subunit
LSIAAAGTGNFISAISPNPDVANIISPLSTIVLMLVGGFYVNLDNIPIYLIWLQAISYYKYGFQAAVVNEFTGLTLTCDPSELVNNFCPVTSGDQVIVALSMQGQSVGVNILYMLLIGLGFQLLSFLSLFLLKKRRSVG